MSVNTKDDSVFYPSGNAEDLRAKGFKSGGIPEKDPEQAQVPVMASTDNKLQEVSSTQTEPSRMG